MIFDAKKFKNIENFTLKKIKNYVKLRNIT